MVVDYGRNPYRTSTIYHHSISTFSTNLGLRHETFIRPSRTNYSSFDRYYSCSRQSRDHSYLSLRTFYAFGAHSLSANRNWKRSLSCPATGQRIRLPKFRNITPTPSTYLAKSSAVVFPISTPKQTTIIEEKSTVTPTPPLVLDTSETERLHATIRSLQNDKASLEQKFDSLQRQFDSQTLDSQNKINTERRARADREKEFESEISLLRRMLEERELSEKSLHNQLADAQNEAKKWRLRFQEEEKKLLEKSSSSTKRKEASSFAKSSDPELAGLSYLKHKLASDMAELEHEMRDAINQLDR